MSEPSIPSSKEESECNVDSSGCDLSMDRFIQNMVIPRDMLPSGYCGTTAKFLTEMSWIDQVVHFIQYGYGRYHPTEAPLQFIEQPNGDPPVVL